MAASWCPQRVSRVLLPLLGLLLVGNGCLCGEGINEGDVNLISLEEEWQLGNRLARRTAERLPLAGGPVQTYVQRIGEQIVQQTDLAEREWTFHVVASRQVNAFALPGGHVYVHTGLIEAASSVEELAGVIAHEVAHGTARHGTERLTQAYGIDTVVGLVVGEQSGVVERLLTRVGRRGAVAKFSRDDEREADHLGLKYLREAGYDPRGMVRFFETLLERRQRRPNALERFFTSHPLTEERLQRARRQLDDQQATPSNGRATGGGPAPLSSGRQRFEQIQQRAAQLTSSP